MDNVTDLKKLGEKVTGIPAEEINGSTIPEVIDFISENYEGVEFAIYRTIGSDTKTIAAGASETFTLDIDAKINNSYLTLFMFWSNFSQMMFPVHNGSTGITGIMFGISETSESGMCVKITVKNESDEDATMKIENYAGLAVKM